MKLIDENRDKLMRLCDLYHVEKLYMFGSALNSNFNLKVILIFL